MSDDEWFTEADALTIYEGHCRAERRQEGDPEFAETDAESALRAKISRILSAHNDCPDPAECKQPIWEWLNDIRSRAHMQVTSESLWASDEHVSRVIVEDGEIVGQEHYKPGTMAAWLIEGDR